LKSGVERRHAGALMLRFVIACGSGRGANVRSGVSAADVGGVGESAVAVAIRDVDVEGVGDVNEAGGVVGVALALAAGDGVGVEGVGDVDEADVVVEVVVAVAGVGVGGVEGARAFAGDGAVCDVDEAGDIVCSVLVAVAIGGVAEVRGGVGTEVGTAGGEGAGGDGNAGGGVGVAVTCGAVGVGAEQAGGVCVDVIVVEIQGRQGAGDIRGVGLSVIGVEGVL